MPEEIKGALLEATAGGGDSAAVIEVAQQAVEPRVLDPAEVYAVPGQTRAQVLDLERYLRQPRRATGTAQPATLDALIEYVDCHEVEGATTIWVHPTLGRVEVVLNDHAAVEPGFGDHRALLAMEHTEEWLRWIGLDGQLVSLEQFAEHIEQSIPEITEPDGAVMLELAQSFSAKTSAAFEEAKRLHSGEVHVRYTEEVKAAAGKKGEIEIPKEFVLGIAPFLGNDPYALRARFRYRLRGGQLAVGYQLIRPDEVIRLVIADVAETLREKFERVYIGSPR